MQKYRCPNFEPDFEIETVPFVFKDGYFISGDIRIAVKDASDELINLFPNAVEWLRESF